MEGTQLDLWLDEAEIRLVKASVTDLGSFGNQVDLIVVTERNVGALSLLEPALGTVHFDGQGNQTKC